eukprot:CAMPEP_0178973870 /NCGR_PEP_ID=MMETSP0789-20121207/22025_1 /TAXON_ID=3005 /ORGANISM="Rhizosolenia setigera, Strain CCMP 1694" /LENGTH=557 /DNA_ID=CAMNT_0020661909 /DNA_START=32 /DNA_END=1701 /DNA_ORIENTATION=+
MKRLILRNVMLLLIGAVPQTSAFMPASVVNKKLQIVPSTSYGLSFRRRLNRSSLHNDKNGYDDISFYEGDDDLFSSLSANTGDKDEDLSGSATRQFQLGYDIILSSYAGNMAFDTIVDWEYFSQEDDEKNIVQPNPLDPNQPRRTRESSGSVIRIFRGELSGRVASMMRSQGKEYRILLKEFSGEMAVELAEAEFRCIGKLQSDLCALKSEEAKNGDWANTASSRYLLAQDEKTDTKEDDNNLTKLMDILNSRKESSPFVGILGRLNIDDLDLEPNEWYRALGVPPPKFNSVWIVYEYAGLGTASQYSQPPLFRRSRLPPQKGFFGPTPPPQLPPWKSTANYVVKGIMKKSLEALAELHENGVVHRSIGRSSIVLSTPELDKSIPTSIYTTNPSQLVIKLTDFGFSGLISESAKDETFRARARAFNINIKDPYKSSTDIVNTASILDTNFAIAEDLHALGFVFLGILLTTLAEPKSEIEKMPDTGEDSLQRLLGEIFEKDFNQFREYCEEEDVWSNVVSLLDENDGAGWDLLESLCFARERVSKLDNSNFQLVTARG